MRKPEVVLSLALAASAGVSLWMWRELQLAREQQAALQDQLQAALAARVEARGPARTVATPAATVAAANPATPPAAPASAQAATKKSGPPEGDEQIAAQRRMLQDPRYREAYREQARLNFGLRRENLIRVAGLSAEQADAVIELQIDRELKWIEDPDSVNQHFAASEREHQARLRELLGEEKHARLQQYMESRASRMRVDQFRNLLGGADMLRDDQVEPLIAALHTENAQLQRELQEFRQAAASWNQFEERRLELEKDAHARMHVSAASILSQTQLQKFDAMLKRELERRAAEQRMQGLQAKIGNADGREGAN